MSSRPRAAIWLVSLALGSIALGATASQQQRDGRVADQTGTGTLAGVVVGDDTTGAPIRRATVSITSSALAMPRELSTDDQGHFAFADLPAGAVSITVSKPGFVTTYYGARRPGRGPGQPTLLAAGQTIANLTVKLLHGASISGTVLNQNGQGQYDMRVRAFEHQMQNGMRTIVAVPLTVSGGLTDDAGNFRLWGLPPGAYVLSVTPEDYSPEITTRTVTAEEIRFAEQLASGGGLASRPQSPAPSATGRNVTYVPVYFPGVTDPSAVETITVAAGEDRAGVNVKLPLVTTARLEGIVVGADGNRMNQGVRFSVVQPQPRPPSAGGLEVLMQSDGKWVIPAVPPGQYTLIARAPSRQSVAAPGAGAAAAVVDLFALLDLHVTGQDLTGLVLTLERGATVSGRVVFDGRSMAAPKDFAAVRVTLAIAPGSPLGGTTQNVVTAADGTFTIVGATPGRYRFSAVVPATAGTGWNLKSAVVSDRDALDAPIDIRPGEDVAGLTLTFTDQTTELSGTLIDDKGGAVTGYLVVVLSADRAHWVATGRRGRIVRPGPDGQYKVTGLPAGEYHLGVIADVDQPDLGDAAFLEPIVAGALRLKLADGEKRVQDLKIVGRR